MLSRLETNKSKVDDLIWDQIRTCFENRPWLQATNKIWIRIKKEAMITEIIIGIKKCLLN